MAMIGFRSVTYAQRAVKILGKAGLRGQIARLPSYLPDTGCGNAVELADEHIPRAVQLIKDAGFPELRVYCQGESGYLEVCS